MSVFLVPGLYDIVLGNYPGLNSFALWARETEEVNMYIEEWCRCAERDISKRWKQSLPGDYVCLDPVVPQVVIVLSQIQVASLLPRNSSDVF